MLSEIIILNKAVYCAGYICVVHEAVTSQAIWYCCSYELSMLSEIIIPIKAVYCAGYIFV